MKTNKFGIHYSRKEYREEYLQSADWKRKSAETLLRDPVCVICENAKSTDAHHLTYELLPLERPEDIVGVCRSCHNVIHRHKKISSESDLSKIKSFIKCFRTKKRINKEMFDNIRKFPKHLQEDISRLLRIGKIEYSYGRTLNLFKFRRFEALYQKGLDHINEDWSYAWSSDAPAISPAGRHGNFYTNSLKYQIAKIKKHLENPQMSDLSRFKKNRKLRALELRLSNFTG